MTDAYGSPRFSAILYFSSGGLLLTLVHSGAMPPLVKTTGLTFTCDNGIDIHSHDIGMKTSTTVLEFSQLNVNVTSITLWLYYPLCSSLLPAAILRYNSQKMNKCDFFMTSALQKWPNMSNWSIIDMINGMAVLPALHHHERSPKFT